MKANKTLTTFQTEAVESILAARPQGKRAAAFGHTLLNRNPRVLRGIRNTYERQAAQMGFTTEQIAAQWGDVRDMASLEVVCE